MANTRLLQELNLITQEVLQDAKKLENQLMISKHDINLKNGKKKQNTLTQIYKREINIIKERKNQKNKEKLKNEQNFDLQREIDNYEINRKPYTEIINGQKTISYGYRIPGN